MTNHKSISVFLAIFLFGCITFVYSDVCCMPHGHRVSLRTTVARMINCTMSTCETQHLLMSYTHYPDLDNYRYRMDYHGEPAGVGPFSEGTTLGFITDKTSLLGYEYLFDGTQCTCRKTTTPSIIFNITCVPDVLQFVGNISLGIGFAAQSYKLNTSVPVGSNTVETSYSMVVENFSQEPSNVPLCALIHEEFLDRVTETSTGQLVELSLTTLEAFNFTPHASDSDYAVPSYCPQPC